VDRDGIRRLSLQHIHKLPDQLHIKIYSLAGRLIQDLSLLQAELKMGFNRIPWDGRDCEGDDLADGVCFSKTVMNVDGKLEEVIQKLTKVR
jgi:flagellar hook assembly protein FlgD